MLIFFEQLEVDYVLTENCPTKSKPVDATIADPRTSTNPTIITAPAIYKDVASISVSTMDIDKFEKDNKTVREHLLNHMTNSLFDLFVV